MLTSLFEELGIEDFNDFNGLDAQYLEKLIV
jgi:hypothetical protein